MSTPAASKVDTIKKHFSLLCDLRRLYKIEIVTDQLENNLIMNYELADIQETTPYLEFLREELSVYPAGMIDKLHLDRIVICSSLKQLEKDVSGCASMSLFPDNLALRMLLFKKNTIYLDVKYGGTADGLVTIHHELFHAIEAHGGTWLTDFDSEWPKLNPADFKYKEDVSSYLKKNYPLDVDGFMSDYSMESIREDKAELFSHMIVNMARVEQIARRDKSVAGKVERMKKLLLAFSPAFNDSFWATRHLRSVQGYLKTEFEDLLLPRVRKHN